MRPFEPLLRLAYGAPRREEPAGTPGKILLIRRNGIGDMICALPLFRRLRARFPQARIDVLASERNACILQGVRAVDHVLVYHRGGGLARNHYFNLRRLMAPIREERYDVAIAATGGFSALVAVITYATGVPRRVGFVPRGGHRLDFCFNLPIAQPEVREHQIERCLRLGEPLGASAGEIDVTFPLADEHRRYAAETLGAHGLRPNAYVLFNASSNRPEGKWTASAIARTAAAIERLHALPMLVCGAPADEALLAASALPHVVTPSIHHFGALVKASRFLMCSDGGPMHVAAAMQTPAFVLFASADPQAWRPWGVPFAYVRSGSRVAAIEVDAVLARLAQWLPALDLRAAN